MLTVLNLTDGFWFQESTSEFVREPPEERINVLVSRLEPKDVWGVIVALCLVGIGLLTIFGESEDVILIRNLFSDESANVAHSTSDLTEELITEVLRWISHYSGSVSDS
jgi:hypothetical protein